MPIACQPTPIVGRNAIWRKLVADAIRGDPSWRGGEYVEQPAGLRMAGAISIMMAASALDLQRDGPTRDAAAAAIDRASAAFAAGRDANNCLYQFDASRTYDAGPGLERITAAVMAVNSADDMFNPADIGVMEREMRRVRRGRYVLLPISGETHGHMTFANPSAWRPQLEQLLAEVRRDSSPRPSP